MCVPTGRVLGNRHDNSIVQIILRELKLEAIADITLGWISTKKYMILYTYTSKLMFCFLNS